MKRIIFTILTLFMLLTAMSGCMAQKNNLLSDIIKDKTVTEIVVTSYPEGYEYTLEGDDIDEVIDYFSSLHLISDFDEDPDEYDGETLCASIRYSDGTSSAVYHFGNMFIRADDGPWYKMDYEEATRFISLLDDLCNEATDDNKETILIGFNPRLREFSYEEDTKIYAPGDPGVKTEGFNNKDASPINAAKDTILPALKECTIDFDSIAVYRDKEADVWMVLFYTEGILGGCESVYLNAEGETVLIVYGE